MAVNFRALVDGGFYSDAPFDKSVPVSIRTNNPGALNVAEWIKEYPGYAGDRLTTTGNSTVIFEAPEYGVGAYLKLLKKYRKKGATSIHDVIYRYSGKGREAEAAAYVKAVVKITGFPADTDIDLENDALLLRVAKAMFRVEAGVPTPLSDAQVLYGFKLERGIEAIEPLDLDSDLTPEKPVDLTSPEGGNPAWLTFLINVVICTVREYLNQPSNAGPVIDWPMPIGGGGGAPNQPDETPWVTWANGEVGFHEEGENLGIERYIALAKVGSLGDPWCAIFANAGFEAVGIRGTRSALARSFEDNENFVELDAPARGAVVTLWRESPSSWKGHVGYYLGENDNGILILQGNASDEVNRGYVDPKRVVGYYWPKSVPLPRLGAIYVGDEDGNVPDET